MEESALTACWQASRTQTSNPIHMRKSPLRVGRWAKLPPLRDDQWERIKDWLPVQEGNVGGTAKDNRLFVDAVIYRYRAGIAWRDLPERFGPWRSVWQRHDRWATRVAFLSAFSQCWLPITTRNT